MPDVASGVALKFNDDAGDGEGVDTNRVLPPKLARRKRNCRIGEDDFAGELVDGNIERPAVEHLEADQVKLDGMGVIGQSERQRQ